MARLIPKDVNHEDFHASFGEMQVYEALKKLPNEYIVFHSLHWNKKEKLRNNKSVVTWGETDFTVFHPKRGIIVIEVKSGGIKCKDGEWKQTNTITGQSKIMKDPMVQCERSKHTFIDILEDKNSRNYRVDCAVWFTSVENYSDLGILPPVYKEGNLLLKKDINNPEKALKRVFDYYGFNENSLYDKNDETSVVKKLSPEFSVVPSISNIIEEEEYYFNRMTAEQNRLIEYLDEQKVASIQGGAGTGKTMLAIEKARRLYEDEETKNDKILFLCFNEFLYEYLKDRYTEEIPNVSFFSMDKLVKNHYKIKGEYATEDEKLDFLNNYTEYDWNYKHIIIDEGQDFKYNEIEALHTISQLEDGCFYLFYDKNQLVHIWETFKSIDKIDCRLVLTSNCRNTKSIASSSNKVLGIEKLKIKNNVIGKKPVLNIVHNEDEFNKKLEEEIEKFTTEKINQNRIVILTVKSERKSKLKNINKIGSYKIRKSLKDKGILFTTARKYKGLEADVVIITDIDVNTFKDEIEKRVLYVGSSRAKHFLSFISLLTNEEKLEICESLTGKRNRKANELIADALKIEIVENV